MKYCLALFLILSAPGLSQICAPAGPIHPGIRITGTLDPFNCTLSDGSPYVEYRLDLPTRGVFSVSLTPAEGVTGLSLILRDASGSKVDSGNSIQRNVERGSYSLLMNASTPNTLSANGGEFALTSSFSGAAGVLCRDFPLAGTLRPIVGSLGSGSCLLPDGSAYDAWQLTLFGGGAVDIAITPSGFSPLLILRTSNGQALASATTPDDSGIVHLVVPDIGNDTYTLVVAVASPDQAGGSYIVTATSTLNEEETCVSQATLTGSAKYDGKITSSSCNFTLPGRDDSAPFTYYRIHLDAPSFVQASIDASDFSSLLLLLDADGNALTEDIESSPTGTPMLSMQLPAGDYRMAVFNENRFGGAYTLNYQATPGTPPPCGILSIDSGAQATGRLSANASCRNSIFLSDTYKLVLPVDGTVDLSLISPDFSAFLDIRDAKDNGLTLGTPAPDGSSSLLKADLPAGTYYVGASTMDQPGAYMLAYTLTPKTLSPCSSPRQMPPNGFIHNTQLGQASCTGQDGRRADFYRFTLTAPASEGIFMTSDSVLPEVTLYGSDGSQLRQDRDSYIDQNAMIVQYLAAGTYQLRLRSADPTEDGPYNLDLLWSQGPPPQLCTPRTLPASGSVSGRTSYTSCAWYDKTFADIYQYTVTDVTQLATLRATSDNFDTFLILMDNKGNVLATADDGAGGFNALLSQPLDPGAYYVIVKPALDPTSAGDYLLTAELAPIAPTSDSRRN